MAKYSKLISIVVPSVIGLAAAFGLNITPEQKTAILGLVPVVAAIAVFFSPANAVK